MPLDPVRVAQFFKRLLVDLEPDERLAVLALIEDESVLALIEDEYCFRCGGPASYMSRRCQCDNDE